MASIGRKDPTKLPVRTHPLPVLQPVDEASADVTPRLDSIEQAMKIVEAEKEKANTYAEQLRIQKRRKKALITSTKILVF